MKKLLLTLLILNSSFLILHSYSDLFKLYELNKNVESVKTANASLALSEKAKSANDTVERVALVRSAYKFAELRLWYLQQTKPKIFIRIATAENATDLGYFRLDYSKEDDFGKLKLLNEYEYLF